MDSLEQRQRNRELRLHYAHEYITMIYSNLSPDDVQSKFGSQKDLARAGIDYADALIEAESESY